MNRQDYLKIFKSIQNGNDVRGAAIATDKEKQTITPDLVQFIARAFGLFLSKQLEKEVGALRIGMGHDSRVTADLLMEAGKRGLAESKVYDCGLITTPAMFTSTILKDSDFDGAIMLTASHLPFNRNGMKFFTKNGSLSHADLDEILDLAAGLAEEYGKEDSEKRINASGLPMPKEILEGIPFDMVSVYSEHMKRIIKEAVAAEDFEHPLSGLHIVVDSGNGASGFFAGRILEELGADVSGSQFLEPDGYFPNHVPNPEDKKAMQAIQKAVLESGADLGVIFDCDGDRGAVVFSDGTEVNRNTLIALLSVIVAEEAPGSVVVTDSVTSDELGVFLTEKLGLEHLRFRRGYKNVIDKGLELNRNGKRCELAIETSGHGAFKENYFSDDGAYIAVKIICRLAKMKAAGQRLESLIEDLAQPEDSLEIRFSIGAEDFAVYGKKVLEDFAAYCEAKPGVEIVSPNYEGVRVKFDDEEVQGWMLLRMSLHDPVMPMNLEAKKSGGCDIILSRMQEFFDRYDKLEK